MSEERDHVELAAIEQEIRQLLAAEVRPDDDTPQITPLRPQVRVNRQLDELIDEARRLLAVANDPPVLFRHGEALVRVGRDDDERPVLGAHSRDSLRERLAVIADWVKPRRDGGISATEPPPSVVGAVLNQPDLLAVPVVDQLVTAPIFGPHGELLTDPGYHSAARVWYEPVDGMEVPPVPEEPTPDDVAAARRWLMVELLGDFPFATPTDRAHALGLVVLPFVRSMISGPTPLHPVDAPTPGTGKGLFLEAALFPALGRTLPAIPEISDTAEMRKQIGAILMEGLQVVRFDNVSERVDSAVLAMALTESFWQARILGVSKNATVPIRCIWVMTGNNLDFSPELGRRICRIRLDVGARDGVDPEEAEHPWRRRSFRHPDLLDWAVEHRAQLVWSALVLVRAWLASGRPPGERELGRFESWSRTIGGIVAVAGGTNFLANFEEVYDQTVSDKDLLCEFVVRWWAEHGDQPVTLQALQVLALTGGDDPFGLIGIGTDRGRSTRFGTAIRKMTDQVWCGFRIERHLTGRSQYQLRHIGSQDMNHSGHM